MARIRFKQLVISSTFGNLTEGTILVCGDAHASHFVDELKAAEYVQSDAPAPKRKESTLTLKRSTEKV